LGSAICGSVVAGKQMVDIDDFASAVNAMTGVQETKYIPDPEHQQFTINFISYTVNYMMLSVQENIRAICKCYERTTQH
jgi:hypothetical protein